VRVEAYSEPGDPSHENEDWVYAAPELMVVLDGLTARGDTGCFHSTAWFVQRLGSAIVTAAKMEPSLVEVLRQSIAAVASEHPECELSHPGTPSAAAAIMRIGEVIDYLILGDTTVLLETASELTVVTDNRIDAAAQAERIRADEYPIGTPEKRDLLIAMKQVELTVRNQLGGYWVAGARPDAAEQALTGTAPDLRSAAALTDGAARPVTMFDAMDWPELLRLIRQQGPDAAVRLTRQLEDSDPQGRTWRRNKRSDDATIAYISFAKPTPDH
jgi:hypothetical protein